MAINTSEEITLRLPTLLVQRLTQAATRRNQPIEDIVTDVLNVSFSPLGQLGPEPMRSYVERLAALPESEIREATQAKLEASEEKRLAQLLRFNKERDLTETENDEIEHLLDRVESMATQRAAALWLLDNNYRRP